MDVNSVLAFSKAAIRVNLAKFTYKDEKILLQAFEMIEEYQHKECTLFQSTIHAGWKQSGKYKFCPYCGERL